MECGKFRGIGEVGIGLCGEDEVKVEEVRLQNSLARRKFVLLVCEFADIFESLMVCCVCECECVCH